MGRRNVRRIPLRRLHRKSQPDCWHPCHPHCAANPTGVIPGGMSWASRGRGLSLGNCRRELTFSYWGPPISHSAIRLHHLFSPPSPFPSSTPPSASTPSPPPLSSPHSISPPSPPHPPSLPPPLSSSPLLPSLLPPPPSLPFPSPSPSPLPPPPPPPVKTSGSTDCPSPVHRLL